MTNGAPQADSLREQVYKTLRTGLRHGGIGQRRTATERDLAEELGVSRTPIREALALLVHDRLIVSTTKGFTLPSITNGDVADIFELRALIEPFAFRSALDHVSRADIKLLRQALDDQIAANSAGDSERFSNANRDFRTIWTTRVLNKRIREVIERYDDHIVSLRELTLSDAENRTIVIDGLLEILKAVESGDAEAAEQAMQEHLMAAEKVLMRTLDSSR